MKVKELERTVVVGWSPPSHHPVLLCAGTAAQQLDASFSTSSCLDIYALNLAEQGLDLDLKCSVPTQNRFHKVVWGGGGGGGVVAGGCDGGRLEMYSVAKMLEGGETSNPLLPHQDRHTGPVRALDFNPFQMNLLASGASESEIFIWDLNNTSTPMTPGAKVQPFEDVMSLAWNRQVQHILASTFATRCIVWDLRKNEPIIKLTDSNSRVRWRVVGWNPDVATQLCLASEEDSNPVVQLWDLRFATTPLKSLQSHSRGVLSLAWCSQDSDLLITAGKDNRIICWNPNSNHPTGEVQCEINTTQQWIFEVVWCPRNPNLIASCSADGHASVYNLTGSTLATSQTTSNKIADSFPGMEGLPVEGLNTPQPAAIRSTVELVKPPKWMRRPAGASFAFGGKLVSFGGDGGSVRISQVCTDSEFVERGRSVLEALNSGGAAQLCSTAASRPGSDPVWPYLEASFSPRPFATIKHLLGYTEVVKKNEDVDELSDRMAHNTFGQMSEDDGYSMEGLVNGKLDSSDMASSQESTAVKKPSKSFRIPTGQDGEGGICRSLLSGEVDEAVKLCLGEGRQADALVLASTAGPALLLKTQRQYFDSQEGVGEAEHLIRAVVTSEWSEFVSCCDLGSWKEALAALLTYAHHQHLPHFCEELGRRLEEGAEARSGSGEDISWMSNGADVCYITAGSISAIVHKKIADHIATITNSPSQLQELVELVMVSEAAALMQGKEVRSEGDIADLLSCYAMLLASQGDYTSALAYLHRATGEEVSDLKARLEANLGGGAVSARAHQHQPTMQQAPGQGHRKFSTPHQMGGVGSTGSQFAKMSPIGAMRSNAAVTHPVYNAATPPLTPHNLPAAPSMNSGLQQGYGVNPPPPNLGYRPPPGQSLPPPPPPGAATPDFTNSRPPSVPPPSHSPSLHQQQHTGKKYLVDPSVGGDSGNSMGGGWSSNKYFNPATPTSHPGQPRRISQEIMAPGAMPTVPGVGSMAPQAAGAVPPPNLNMGIRGPPGAQLNQSAPPPSKPTMVSAQNYLTGKSGWNDPPVLSSTHKSQKKSGEGVVEHKAPITSPLAPPPPGQLEQPLYGPGAPPPGAPGLIHHPQPPPPSSFSPYQPHHQPPPPPASGMYGGGPPQGGMGGPPQGSLPPQQHRLGSGMPPQMAGGPPPMAGGPPPMAGGPPPMAGAHPPMTGGPPPPMAGAHPPMAGGPPPMAGAHPPMTGGPPPPMAGAHPPMAGGPPPPMAGAPPPSMVSPPPMGPPQSHRSASSVLPPPPMDRQQAPGMGAPPSSNTGPPQGFHNLPPSATPPPPSAQVNGGGGGLGGSCSPQKQCLPDDLRPLQDTLESLRTACYQISNNPQVKRKLEDVARKLECLYDALRDSKLSGETRKGLEDLVAELRQGNYTGALGLHTRMISGPDFSQISAFMPALKVLIQTALQLNVYL